MDAAGSEGDDDDDAESDSTSYSYLCSLAWMNCLSSFIDFTLLF
jgi:hypothetical protein